MVSCLLECQCRIGTLQAQIDEKQRNKAAALLQQTVSDAEAKSAVAAKDARLRAQMISAPNTNRSYGFQKSEFI